MNVSSERGLGVAEVVVGALIIAVIAGVFSWLLTQSKDREARADVSSARFAKSFYDAGLRDYGDRQEPTRAAQTLGKYAVYQRNFAAEYGRLADLREVEQDTPVLAGFLETLNLTPTQRRYQESVDQFKDFDVPAPKGAERINVGTIRVIDDEQRVLVTYVKKMQNAVNRDASADEVRFSLDMRMSDRKARVSSFTCDGPAWSDELCASLKTEVRATR